MISGATTKYNIPVTITNLGNIPAPTSTPPLEFQVFLHDTTGDTDTVIATPTSIALRSLGTGRTRMVNLKVPIPITIGTGTYQVLVKTNASNLLAETSTTNNGALSSQIVTVTQGFYGLTGTLGASTFPVSTNAESHRVRELRVVCN